MNVTIVTIIAVRRITSLSMLSGKRMVVAAIGIDVDKPTMIDKEFKITLERFLNVARL